MKRLKRLSTKETLCLKRAAYHEMGHWLVANHFGLASAISIKASHWRRWRKAKRPIRNSPFKASCKVFSDDNTSKFAMAAIGWAGAVAEILCEDDAFLADPSFERMWALLGEAFPTRGATRHVSPSDAELIVGHPQLKRTLKSAMRVLVMNIERLAREGAILALATSEWLTESEVAR